MLLLCSATLQVQDTEQQATGGAGVDASETGSIVKTATSQVTQASRIECADEAAAAPKAAGLETPYVTYSPEKAAAGVTGDAETAAVAPKADGLEAPDETASPQETDVAKHVDNGKAAELEATGETTSSWVADVAEKKDVEEAAAAKEADAGQTAQRERQRVYLTQAIVRSVSPRPLIVSSLVCANARRFPVYFEGMHLQAYVLQFSFLMLLLAVLDGFTQFYNSRCMPNGTSVLSACTMEAAVVKGLCKKG